MSISRVGAPVDISAIRANIREIKKGLPEGQKFCAVIKADAYGHGAIPVAKALSDTADFFGVATSGEALELREAGVETPILVLGYVWPEDYPEMIRAEIRIPLFKEDDGPLLAREALRQGKKALVHLKIDTGMNRIGFQDTPENIEAIRRLRLLPELTVEGIFTHFARADEEDLSFTRRQYETFCSVIRRVEEGIGPIPVRHCCNSAGSLVLPEMCLDMVRLGISMYGLYPSDEVARTAALRPALSLKSHIVFTKTVEKGQGISYNHIRVLEKDRRVATVPVGYGDGYPRLLSDHTSVLVRGKRAPILGRICMDQFMIDITDIPEATDGDEVTLIGRDGGDEITVNELSALCGRFPYELLCDLGLRIPRVYSDDPEH